MSGLEPALMYLNQRHEMFLEDFKTFLKIPSVSTLSEHKADLRRAATWLREQLDLYGFTHCTILETGGHPAVYAERLDAGANRPTVLVYGHYDVQPVDPIKEWLSPPFEPTVRGENLYARGASDMKGQLICFLKAIEAIVRTSARLPVNLKILFEGEEEIGSPNLKPLLEREKARLTCDFCLNIDSGILASDAPGIVYGLRGLVYFELCVQGPARDLHSGMFGGAVQNPAEALARLIAGMHDEQGRITLPGIYDQVRPLSASEREEMGRLPSQDDWWQEKTGVAALHGEAGYTANERVGARPSLTVNGFLSGFTGEGAKTVLPAKAMAKLSMRLVPDQTPDFVEASLRKYLEVHAPRTIRWELIRHSGSPASIVERDRPYVKAAELALSQVWGKRPFFLRQGGSIPIVGAIQQLLKVDSLLLGFGLPDDNLHAPNEKQHLPTHFKGMETFVRYLYLLQP